MINTETKNTVEETRWEAVLNRDPALDGIFYYGVRSTRIYCRNTCSSRRPQRQQVVFFSTCDEAEQAGFRACRRCYPRQAITSEKGVQVIHQACRLIDEHTEGVLSLDSLSKELNISPSHLHRLFKSVTGVTPHQYATAARLRRFKSQVKNGQELAAATYEAGFGSPSRLYEAASKSLGMTPASYRRGGAGMQISYTVVECYLGYMLVAATEKGVCAVSFADTQAALESYLKNEYPAAHIQRGEASLKIWVNALLEYLDGKRPNLALPLELQATSFQLRVWEELRKIPYGETRTYANIARAIGKPEAARAVANACAKNPAAIVTPCHRVVRSDGTSGGYRWGIERKQALLAREQSKQKKALNSPA